MIDFLEGEPEDGAWHQLRVQLDEAYRTEAMPLFGIANFTAAAFSHLPRWPLCITLLIHLGMREMGC